MAGNSGFYKGEKKKQKKGGEKKQSFSGFNAPTFQLPEIISKKKKDY